MADSLYDDLKALIYAKRHTEKECREYLKYTLDMLFKVGGTDIQYVEEWRGHSGDSDYVVSGKCTEGGDTRNHVYVWESKAPQCFVFEEDRSSQNRLIPSEDLFQAENQLLNYYDELRDSGEFKARFNISLPSQIHIGGIIIGCDRTKVKGDFIQPEEDFLYNKAFRCRQIFYEGVVKLLLWNNILEHLQPPKLEDRHIPQNNHDK